MRTTGVEKQLPGTLATLLPPELVAHRPVRVLCQDEARFGRMVRPTRCWALRPLRPVLRNGYEREFVYVYGAVSPLEGELDWRLCRAMNTVRMGEFLTQIGQAHPREFIVMVVDGASVSRVMGVTCYGYPATIQPRRQHPPSPCCIPVS